MCRFISSNGATGFLLNLLTKRSLRGSSNWATSVQLTWHASARNLRAAFLTEPLGMDYLRQLSFMPKVDLSLYKQREQAYVKHCLLEEYLPEWAYKVGS